MATFRRLILAGVVALSVFGAGGALASVKVRAIANTPIAFNGTGDYLGKITYEARFAAASTGVTPVAQTMYYQRNIVVPKASVGALAKGWFKRTPAGLASTLVMMGAISGVGWVVDQFREIQTQAAQAGLTRSGSQSYYQDVTHYLTAASVAGLAAKVAAAGDAASPTTHGWVCQGIDLAQGGASTPITCSLVQTATGNMLYYTPQNPYSRTQHYAPNGVAHSDDGTPAVVATDLQVAPLIQANPNLWPEPFKWPNGNPVTLAPMTAQAAEVAAQYRTDTGIPKPVGVVDAVLADETSAATSTTVAAPVPSPTAAPSTVIGSVTAPATEAAGGALDFPVFCTWAATVCAALDWLTDDPAVDNAPELPEVDAPVVNTPFVSGLGSGSCPGGVEVPLEFAGTNAGFEFSYQPMCDLAVMINPLTNVFALLIAAFIVAGVRKRA